MSIPSHCETQQVVKNNITYYHGMENDLRLGVMRIRVGGQSERADGNIPQPVLDDIQQKAADVYHTEMCSDPFIGKGKKAKRIRAKFLGVCFRCARWNCRRGWRDVNNEVKRCNWRSKIPSINGPLYLDFIDNGVDASKRAKKSIRDPCGMCRKDNCSLCLRISSIELSRIDDYRVHSDDEPDIDM